ncbi:hypothetical protein [Nostoc sp.]|uniref:hypothetical protein n=1 Tax=Nostoc sp. TaxID=1180 RepID=UPI002FF62E84
MSTMVTELVVPLPYETLRERGSKLARASPRVVRAMTLSYETLRERILANASLRDAARSLLPRRGTLSASHLLIPAELFLVTHF